MASSDSGIEPLGSAVPLPPMKIGAGAKIFESALTPEYVTEAAPPYKTLVASTIPIITGAANRTPRGAFLMPRSDPPASLKASTTTNA